MSDINVKIIGDKALADRFARRPPEVRAALKTKTQVLALKLQNKIVTQKLSGQVLNRRTGKLARSIFSEVEDAGEKISGIVGSSGDVKYAGIHEFGGQTSPHDILPVKAKVLAFMMNGKQVFAKKVRHPGSKMPERSFLRSSLSEMRPEIGTGLRQAVIDALKKGKSNG